MWPQLGWFCGLVCAGSVAGAVAWGSQMRSNNMFYAANTPGVRLTPEQRYVLLAATDRWYASFLIFYGVEFLCLIIPKLMLLGRLTDNAASLQDCVTVENRATGGARGSTRGARGSLVQVLRNGGFDHEYLSSRALLKFHRVMAAAIILCSVASMVAFDVGAVYFVQASVLSDQAAANCVQGSDSNSSRALSNEVISITAKAYTAEAVQNFSEAIALLLVSVSYVVIVPACVVLFRRAELVAAHALASAGSPSEDENPIDVGRGKVLMILEDTMHAAAEQRRRLLLACILVLVTFPIRVSFDLLQAYSAFDTSYNPECDICSPCQSDPWLIYQYFTYTPEFWSIVVALSSPLPLTLSLWLITSAHARALAIAVNVQQAGLSDNLL